MPNLHETLTACAGKATIHYLKQFPTWICHLASMSNTKFDWLYVDIILIKFSGWDGHDIRIKQNICMPLNNVWRDFTELSRQVRYNTSHNWEQFRHVLKYHLYTGGLHFWVAGWGGGECLSISLTKLGKNKRMDCYEISRRSQTSKLVIWGIWWITIRS